MKWIRLFKAVKKEPEYDIAQEIIDKIAARFQIDIPEAEIGYITMHLQGAKLRQHKGGITRSVQFTNVMQAKKLIHNMEEATG